MPLNLKSRAEEGIHRVRYGLLRRGLLPANRDFRRFVIICRIRTGSTMLCSLLDSHPQVCMFFELFHRNRQRIPFSVPGFRAISRDAGTLELRQRDPARFLEEIVFGQQPPGIKAVGFKLLYAQGRSKRMWWNEPEFDRWWQARGREPQYAQSETDLWESLRTNRDLAIIHLVRRNMLRGKLSGITAQKTGKWGVGATGGAGKGESVRVSLNVSECLADFEAWRRIERETDEFFQGHPLLKVTYEDMTADQENTMNEVQSFLGLDCRPLQTRTVKQARKPLREVIENYGELESALNGTPWSSFLDDDG